MKRIAKIKEWKKSKNHQFTVRVAAGVAFLERINDGEIFIVKEYVAYGYLSKVFMTITQWDIDMIHVYIEIKSEQGFGPTDRVEINRLRKRDKGLKLYIESSLQGKNKS